MNTKQKKEPMSKEQIFKIMRNITFVVAVIFCIKDIISGDIGGAIFIAVCLVVLAAGLILMKKFHVSDDKQQLIVSLAVMLLIFLIGINSGQYYSDDYMLYLASYALAGLYLNPNITKVQIILGDILFFIMYLIKPQNVESTSQYIMCMFIFTLAGIMIYLVIQRGSAFIDKSEQRAAEAMSLLNSMKMIGEELQNNFESSSGRMDSLKNANEMLSSHASELKYGSTSITDEARNVTDSCDQVHEKLDIAENQIQALEDEMQTFEGILSYNQTQMVEMGTQVSNVNTTIHEANVVFEKLNNQMAEITDVLKHLNAISAKTTMLALNASIEAAHAGSAGVGFAVVASQVQALAVDSTKCAGEVSAVLDSMKEQIRETSEQLSGTTDSINASLNTLNELQDAFGKLNNQFGSLHSNIEVQNNNIDQVNLIFSELKDRISYMSEYSEDNQSLVEAIAAMIDIYKENVELVIDDTKQIHDLSVSMLQISNKS